MTRMSCYGSCKYAWPFKPFLPDANKTPSGTRSEGVLYNLNNKYRLQLRTCGDEQGCSLPAVALSFAYS